jgi:hypothetical protein
MIVFYREKDGSIKGTLEGNYDISRHNLDDKNWIEVKKQPLKNKKVNPETQELVEQKEQA